MNILSYLKNQREWAQFFKYMEESNILGLQEIAQMTNDCGLLYDIIGYFYQKKLWAFISAILENSNLEQDIVQNYIYTLVKNEERQLQTIPAGPNGISPMELPEFVECLMLQVDEKASQKSFN